MTIRRTGTLLDFIRHLADRAHTAAPEDAGLLDAFVAQRDEAAFAALVQRHGSLVWGTCRRLLSASDAEDAFQATFLVLVCRARDIDRNRPLGAWLHGVAYRVALKARARAVSGARHERAAATLRPTETHTESDERPGAREEIDAALDRLPERFRLPLVLCYLEGKTNAEAAEALGVPVGSMSKRLDRARQMLRERLEGREAAALAGLLPVAPLPVALETATVRSAILLAAGGVGVVPNQAAGWLVRDAMRGVWLAKLKWVAAAVAVAIGLFGGIVGLGPKPHASADTSSAPGAPPSAEADGPDLPAQALARLGSLWFRHPAPVSWVGFSPDGKILASADRAGHVRFWNATSGKLIRECRSDEKDAYFAAFSPDGATLALQGHNLHYWDVKTGTPIGEPISGGRVTGVTFLPDGKSVALDRTSPKGVAISVESVPDAKTISVLAEDEFGAGVCTVALSSDGKTMAVRRSQQNGLTLWDVATGKRIHTLQWKDETSIQFGAHPLTSTVSFSADGKRIATGIAGTTIRLWDVANGKPIQDLTYKHIGIPTIAFSPDGQSLITAMTTTEFKHQVIVWGLEASKPVRDFGPFPETITSLTISRDGTTLAVATGEHVVRLFDLNTGKERLAPQGHVAAVVGLSVSSDGKTIISAAEDGSVCLWSAPSGKLLRQDVPSDRFSISALSGEGAALAFVAPNDRGHVRVYDPFVRKERLKFDPGPFVRFLAVSPDGKVMAVAGRAGKESPVALQFHDTSTGKLLDNPDKADSDWYESIVSLAFSPDGKTFWTAHRAEQRGYLNGWDLEKKKDVSLLEVSPRIEHAAIAPNGQRFAVVPEKSEGTPSRSILLWDRATGKETRLSDPDRGVLRDQSGKASRLQTMTLEDDFREVGTLTFTPDSQMLLSGHDRTIRLWEIASGKVRATLTGHEALVQRLAVLPGGRALASAGADGTVLLWDLSEKAFAKDRRGTDECWNGLADDDAAVAFQSICGLVLRPNEAVPLLKDRLKAAAVLPPGRVAELLKALDAPQAEVREQATDELEILGELAVPELRKALEAQPSLEVSRRLESILDRATWRRPSGRQLQPLRAVEALRRIGTPAARDVVAALSKGPPEARLTQEARAALTGWEAGR